jgi:YidC/Oxa1 family membrane protein insertase
VLGVPVGDTSGATHDAALRRAAAVRCAGQYSHHAADGTATGEDLKPLIQFGSLKIIAEPLFLLLRFVYGFVGNWGWAIIIVTVVFNLLMLPTRVMMMKSSLKMQRIQPKIDAIKKRMRISRPPIPSAPR